MRYFVAVLSFLIFLSGCAQKEKNVSMSDIEERIVSEIKLDNPLITDLRGNRAAAERYGVPLSIIEDGFVYTNGENGGNADEIIVLKVKDKKNISEVEKALETEITGLTAAWEKAGKEEYEKIQKHILRSKGKYVMLAISEESKKAEEIFNSILS